MNLLAEQQARDPREDFHRRQHEIITSKRCFEMFHTMTPLQYININDDLNSYPESKGYTFGCAAGRKREPKKTTRRRCDCPQCPNSTFVY